MLKKSLVVMASALVGLGGANTAQAEPMRFKLATENALEREAFNANRQTIYASGDITADVADRFKAFVSRHGIRRASVALESDGGNAIGGVKLGEAIREFGFDTVVKADPMFRRQAICASACGYAFAGGVYRFYDSRTASLGLHQFYRPGGVARMSETQITSAILVNYFNRMGVDPDVFTFAALNEATSMGWLTTKDAIELNLVNNGFKPTTHEIKLFKGKSSLHLYQERYTGDTSAVISCMPNNRAMVIVILHTDHPTATRKRQQNPISYLEVDGREYGRHGNYYGLMADEYGLWVAREVDRSVAAGFVAGRELAMWMEPQSGQGLRWGTAVDLVPVRAKIADYLRQC